jgi:hypothetical protein
MCIERDWFLKDEKGGDAVLFVFFLSLPPALGLVRTHIIKVLVVVGISVLR